MSPRPFRFGVVAAPVPGHVDRWGATVRRLADQGYSSLLVPDGLQLLAPGPALATAAAAADIRIGTWVYAAPLRPPRATAWEAHSLSMLTDGRFEMGIGAGRPAVEDFTKRLDLPYGSAAQRLGRVHDTVTGLRDLDGPHRHAPVLIAAGGPHARQLAAHYADTKRALSVSSWRMCARFGPGRGDGGADRVLLTAGVSRYRARRFGPR